MCGDPQSDGVAPLRQLLAQSRCGCRESLGLLIEAFRDYLLRIANEELPEQLRQRVAASDLVQMTVVEAIEGFARFSGEKIDEFRGWLRRILLRNLHDALRHHGMQMRDVQKEIPLEVAEKGVRQGETISPGDEMRRLETWLAVEQAVSQLSVDHQRVIYLRNRDGLTFVEIAQQLERSPDAVRKLWGRAVVQLQQHLATHDESEQ